MKKIFVLLKSSMLFTIVIVNLISFNLYGIVRETSNPVSSRLQQTQCILGTWNGQGLTRDWNESNNWCDGQVPTSTTNVIIPMGVPQPIISGNAECNNITINQGAILTIEGSNTLAIYGNWFNNGGFVANYGTVNYCGNNQIISGNAISVYNNVIIGGIGTKNNFTSNFTVNGILSIEGPSIVNQTPTYGPNATLIYNYNYAKSTGNEWPANFTSKGGIIIDGVGIITTTSVKNMDELVPLIINPEATLAINEKDITLKGDFHNNGTFSVTAASITIGGIQTQIIDGFTTTGNLIISKTMGTATLTSNVNANELRTTNAGTINLGEGLTHTFTGTWQKGNSTVNCGSSTLRLGSGYIGTQGTFISNAGTVEWFSIGNHNICGLPYNHLVISGTGIKTPIGSIDMTGDLIIHAGAKLQTSQSYIRSNYSGRSLIVNGMLFVSSTFPLGFTYFENAGGTIDYNGELQNIMVNNYNNLILSGQYTKTFLGNTPIINNLTIKDGVQCKLTGFSCTANTLTLGDYGQVSGTWGGASSGATYVNNSYFISSSGILTVNESIITPGLWLGRISSDWSTPSNWSDGIVPTSQTDAILSSTGIDPKINNSAACNNLTILNGAILTINNANNLMVGKDWINKGTFISNTGTVNFNGDNQLVGLGPFYNLTLSNNGIKTISPLEKVNNILSIEGTATVSNSVSTLSIGTLQYNTSIPRITGIEWPITPNFSKIIFTNTGEISLSNSKSLTNIPILIKENATLNINNFNLTSSGVLNLECGGLNNGSIIKGTGILNMKGNINVLNAEHGSAPAKILCKMNMAGNLTISIANGNQDKSIDTDLLVNTLEGNTFTIDKNGEGTLYINTSGKLGNLNIHAGNVIIPAKAEVTINGTTINNVDGLQIQSDENGSGSLITSTALGIGTATVKCFMTSKAWHLIAPPIATQNIGTFLLSNVSIPTNQYDERGIRDYDPVLNEWKDFFTNTTQGNLTFGKGYATRVRDSQTHEIIFSGLLKAGNLTVGSLIPDKWNCIGNPYTSAIAINLSGTGTNTENFLTVNALNIDPAYGIYIWDRTDEYNGLSNQYTAISNVPTSGFNFPVQIGQAFMVKMASDKTSVNFTKAMQLHNTALKLKSTEAAWPIIELIASTDSLNSKTIIAFHEGMTNGLDPTYDAGLLRGDSPLEISTRLIVDYGIPFSIQALPDNVYESTIVPIDLVYTLGGILYFSAKGINLPDDCNAILEDRLNNTFTNLINQNYTTSLSENTLSTGRFYLHTSYATTSIDKQKDQQSIKAWSNRYNQFCIQGIVSQNAKAELFDLQGRMIYKCELNCGHYNQIEIPTIQPGIYILYVKEKNLTKAFKLAFMQW